MSTQNYKGHIEALLFCSGDPLTQNKLTQILEIAESQLLLLIEELKKDMAASDRGLAIIEVAGGYQMCTKPELAALIERLAVTQEARLSSAAMETLSIIAFKQPITKQEIESIRGVKIDRVLHTLAERQLIRELGRKEALGRPILYGTTDEFLQCFGLNSLQDMPNLPDFIKTEQPE